MAARLIRLYSSRHRRLAAALLVASVCAMHIGVAWIVEVRVIGFGDARKAPARLQAAFVRELQQAAPPATPPTPVAPTAARRKAAKPAPAASNPTVEREVQAQVEPDPPKVVPEVVPEPEAEQQAMVEPIPEPAADSASEPQPATEAGMAEAQAVEPGAPALQSAAAAQGAASAPTGVAFEWPASTRLSYTIVGNYRGEVRGNAQVEWLRSGERYQVHLDVTIGPAFAPLLTRRMSSDGVLSSQGLSPRRYDELTHRAFSAPRVVTMRFESDEIVLGNGQRRATLPGVQDTASQFVQLIWLFTTQPDRLRPGNTIDVPLALPRSVDHWTYDVLEEETLYAPFGAVQAVHLKPRRVSRPGGELTVETWFAPTLQYLPVRIRIHQDPETFIDLMLERPPLQAVQEGEPPKRPVP